MKKFKVPDTAGEFIRMAEEAAAQEEAFDPFMGASTSDKLPGYFGGAAAAAVIVGLVTQTHSQWVAVAGVAGLVVLALGTSGLNAWVVRERHRTLRTHAGIPATIDPDELH